MTKTLACLSAVLAVTAAAVAVPPRTAPTPEPMKVAERIEACKGITVAKPRPKSPESAKPKTE